MQLSGFGISLLFIVGSIGFILVTLLAGKLLRPNKPTPDKQVIYESGEEPVGTAWGHFNFRFYIVALVFILFEAELVFIFPWATVFGSEELNAATNGYWSQVSFIEVSIFVIILIVGLAYVWVKGMLDWQKPAIKAPSTEKDYPVSLQQYEQFNQNQ